MCVGLLSVRCPEVGTCRELSDCCSPRHPGTRDPPLHQSQGTQGSQRGGGSFPPRGARAGARRRESVERAPAVKEKDSKEKKTEREKENPVPQQKGQGSTWSKAAEGHQDGASEPREHPAGPQMCAFRCLSLRPELQDRQIGPSYTKSGQPGSALHAGLVSQRARAL